MSNETFCHYGQLMQVSKMNCDFTHILSHDFIHVDSTEAETHHPGGQSFWCKMKSFVTMANWCKLKKKSD